MLLQEPQLTPPQSSLRFSRGGWASAHSAQIAIGVSLLALFAVCLHWWHPGYVIAQGDNPPLITPGIWFEKALGAWSNYNTYFGQVDGSFTFVPFMLLWWTADWLFGGSLGQIVTQYATVAAAWTGAYFFARSLRVNVPAAAAAAWLYTINPFTQIVFGPTLTMGMFFGIIAWAGVWIAKAAAFPAHRGRARLWLTLLAFAAMPVLGPTPSLVFQMALGCIVLGGCFLLIADARGEFLRWSAGTASMMIAASLWWAVPDALSFVGATIPHPTALSDLSWTYARSSLLNNLRFLYTWLWGYPEYFPAAAAYDANLLTYAAGFFPVVAAAAGLITLRGRRLTICRYALAVALIVMFVSKGTHPPFAWLNGALAAAPGAFLIYADPGGEVALALLFLSAAAALVLDRAQVSALAASFAAVALSGICLINGSIFHGTVVGSNSQLMPSQYVKVPAYWRAAADYLNGARTPGGVLLLPPHLSPGYDVQYDFGYYGIDSVATNLVSRRLLYLDAGLTAGLGYLKHPPSQELADRLRDLLAVRSPLAPLMMRDLGIRYVLYRNDVVHTQHEWFSQKEVSALLQREPMQFGPLAVYDLGPAQSSFTLSERWITGGYGRENAGDMAELAALEEPLPRVDIASVPAHFPAHPALIEQSESVIDGADDARPFGGSEPGVDRAVSFTSDAALGKIHVVVKGQSRRELRVSLARMSAPVDVADIPLSNLQPAAAQDLALLTSHPAAVEKKQGRLALRQIVHNYNPRAIWADVLVRVPAEPPRTYTLTAQNARYDAAEETAPSGILLRFRHVLIPEGRTALGLFGRPVRRARALAAATHDIRVAGVPYSFAFMSLRSTGDSQSDPVIAANAVSLGSTTIGFTGADHPSIEFLPAPSTAPMLTALLTFASHNVLYRCAALLLPNQPVHLDYAAGSCLRQNSLPVDMGALRFSGVELIAPADRNDLSQLKNAVAGARLVETAWQGSFTPMLPARGTVQTSGRVLRLSSGGNLTSAEIGPPLGLGPAQGALVSGQIGGRAVKGVVSFSGPRALSIEEADHTVDWVPNRSADALAISGYRLPVTLNWRIPGLRDAVVGLRIDGCAADGGGTVSLSGTAGGKPQAYHQSLAAAGDGRGLLATLGTVQAFAGPSARLTGISAICAADVPQGGSQVVDAQLTLLRRPSKAAAPVIVRALQGSAGPAAMHLGRISPMASVAAAGAPPAPAPPPALDCQSPGVHCSMGGVRAPLPADFEGLAVLNRLYDPSWIAVVAGHGLTFPKHVVADGWRNAWFVSQGGELFVLNLMNVLSAAGLLLGFGIIAWQLRYRRS